MSHCVKTSSLLMREARSVWHGTARRSPFSDRDGCLSSPVMASVMNGLHCQGKKGKRGPGSPLRINMYAQEDLLRMLKTPDPVPAPRPPLPCPLALLSPASLTDKPLGASRRGTEAEEGGLRCVYVWVHVYLHEVCQQVSRGAGMSANSRSTWHAQARDARARTTQIHPLLML